MLAFASHGGSSLSDQLVPAGSVFYLARSLGAPAWFFDRTMLHSSDRPPSAITVAQFFQILRNLRANLGLPDAHLGRYREARLPVSGGLALALQNAPSLGDALAFFADYSSRAFPFLRYELIDDADALSVGITPIVENDVTPLILENGLSVVYRFMMHFIGRALPETVIDLTHAPLFAIADYDRFFDGQVRFQQDSNAITVPGDVGRLTTLDANPRLWLLGRQQAESDLADLGRQNARQAILSILRDQLQPGCRPITIDQTATLMGTSARTLARKLAREGVCYQEIVDLLQKERAQIALAEPGFNAARASELLGFADQSSFGRSYRRWFGVSPSRHLRTSQ